MEKETMQSVFQQCPNEKASYHHQCYLRKFMAHSNGHRDAPAHNGQPNGWNRPPDCPSQELFFKLKMSQMFKRFISMEYISQSEINPKISKFECTSRSRTQPSTRKRLYLPKITFKKSRAFLAHNWLVNPLLIIFSKMTYL